MMIISPKCHMPFNTTVFIWNRTKMIRFANIVLLILLMSNLFTFRLGAGALLITSLVAIGTIYFSVWEQSSQIRDLQQTLHSLCWKAVAHQIESSDSTREDIIPQYFHHQHHLILPLYEGSCYAWSFLIWVDVPYHSIPTHVFRAPTDYFGPLLFFSRKSLSGSY